jgi:hypothetical protein
MHEPASVFELENFSGSVSDLSLVYKIKLRPLLECLGGQVSVFRSIVDLIAPMEI